MDSESTAYGHCCDCGRLAVGRVVGRIEQNSGAGLTVTVCRDCDNQPSPAPRRTAPCHRSAATGPDAGRVDGGVGVVRSCPSRESSRQVI